MTRTERSLFDFGPLAERYDQWYDTPAGKRHDRVQGDDVQRLLPPAHGGQVLLDVGCGTGHWSRFFASLGYRVVGVDISKEMIHHARRRRTSNCLFAVADALMLPFDDHRFDVVTAMAMLEFISDPAAGLQEMARCAAHGGRMLIGTLNARSILNRQRRWEGRQPYASGHLFSPNQVRSLLARWGEVRMIASTPDEPNTRSLVPRRPVRRLPMLHRRLRGSFIVAEVRR